MSRYDYRLNHMQINWLNSNPNKEDLRRFLINGPVSFSPVMGEHLEIKFAGTLRGVRVTKPVASLSLAIKEAEQIRNEYIQIVGMIPLDEDDLGIADAKPQGATA